MTHPTSDQEDTDLLDQCLGVYLTGVRSAEKIARIIAQQELDDPKAKPTPEFIEVVRRAIHSGAFIKKTLWARENPKKYVHDAALKATPDALRSVVWMASERNPDKRTRTTNAQFLLAAAAELSPTQKHEMGANEEFMTLFKEIFPKGKETEASVEEPTKAEGTD